MRYEYGACGRLSRKRDALRVGYAGPVTAGEPAGRGAVATMRRTKKCTASCVIRGKFTTRKRDFTTTGIVTVMRTVYLAGLDRAVWGSGSQGYVHNTWVG